jgi:predicted GIY-YIG superfamily endonuclease
MFVYVLKNDEGFYKIGYSKNIKKRIKELETANSGNLYLIREFKTEYASKIEARLHSYFKFQQINRE